MGRNPSSHVRRKAGIVFFFTGLCADLACASRNRLLPRQTATVTVTEMAPQVSVTAVSDCHLDGSSVFCLAGSTEYLVQTTVTATSDLPPSFTGCHNHGSETFCLTPDGDDVEIELASEHAEEDESHGDHDEEHESPDGGHCHFHAGVEHCDGSESADAAQAQCDRIERDYNIPLRVGLLFVILATSGLGVFSPIILVKFFHGRLDTAFIILKQFGTGVIISTAFVHLFTHANLMFSNPCLGETAYESTAAAILMAGLFLSFLVEYLGRRYVEWRAVRKSESEEASAATTPVSTEMLNIIVLEAGIIFHSLIIGLTLVVAGDSFFLILFAVILFHQMFEGIALGTRIAALGNAKPRAVDAQSASSSSSNAETPKTPPVSLTKKLLLATAFAIVTPLGMAIGIGVLQRFNGNDPATIVAIGTLDAFSAGILVWVGVVEMWAEDWMLHGEMARANVVTTSLGMAGLVAGMMLMSLLGKWA